MTATVFVSHATPDREFIERHLIPFLQGHGVKTWYCKEQIGTGAHWERAIRDGLESSDWFLVVVSPSSVKSEWVKTEVDWAVEHRMERLIPVIIGPGSASDIHLRLRMVQAVDWREVSNEAKGRLLDALPVAGPAADGDPSNFRQVDGYLYPRPKNWHCIFCGWHCEQDYNDYLCNQCDRVRPFAGGQATMMQCRSCEGFSLGLARFCEWCGTSFNEPAPE
jgi:hypothetical protein